MTAGTKKYITEHLQEIIEDYGWSEYRLTLQSGLSASTIANIYRRGTTPGFHTLEAICNAFGITLSEFFEPGYKHADLPEDQREFLKLYDMMTGTQRDALKQFLYAITK